MINRLSDRDKITVCSGAAVLLLLVLWFGVVTPYRQGMKLTESRIASRQGQLEEARRLQQEYFTLQRVLTTAEKKLAGTARGFSLFSFIEDITTRTGIRENLVSMRPQTPQVQGDFKEELVEIRLERIGLEQMVKFLHAIESADTTLQVKNVRIKPRFDNRTQLDTVLIVSSLQRTA